MDWRPRRNLLLGVLLLLALAALASPGWLRRAGPGAGPARALAALASPETSQIRLYNAGTREASILIDYYDQAGSLILSDESVKLPSRAGLTVSLRDNPRLPSGFRGSVAVSSDQPLTTLLVRETLGPPPAYAITSGVSQGFPRLHLPLLMRSYSSPPQSSRFTLQNLADRTACVAITYWDGNGRQVHQEKPGASAECPQGGMALAAQSSLLRDQALEARLGAGFLGGATVETLPGVVPGTASLAAVVELAAEGRAAAYTAPGYSLIPAATFDDVGPFLLLPLLYRRFGGWTSLVHLQRAEVEIEQPLTVSVAYYPYGSSAPLLTRQIPLRRQGIVNLAVEAGLPEGFVGSAIVSSSRPLSGAVLLRAARAGEQAYTVYNAIASERASLSLPIPLAYRNYGGLSGRSSSLSFQVVDGGQAQVTLSFRADAGGEVIIAGPFTVRGSLTLSLRSPLLPLPEGFIGTAQVTASRPVALLVHTWTSQGAGDTAGTYTP